MSNRDWIKYTALGVACLLFLACGASAWWHYHEENAQKRDEAARHDIATPQEPVEFKCRDAGNGVICEMDRPSSESTDEHTKADLKAQQDTAEWSFLTMLFTGSGLFLTIAGLYYVAKSLGTTRDAVDLARKEFLATHRPKIRFNTCEFVEFGPNVPLTCKVTMINTGESDAHIFLISASFIVRDGSGQKDFGPDNEEHEQGRFIPGEQFSIDWTTEHTFSNHLFESIIDGSTKLYFDGAISYRDGNGVIRFTHFCRQYDLNRRKFLRLPKGHEYEDSDFEN